MNSDVWLRLGKASRIFGRRKATAFALSHLMTYSHSPRLQCAVLARAARGFGLPWDIDPATLPAQAPPSAATSFWLGYYA